MGLNWKVVTGSLAVLGIFTIGTAWSFFRGANDFSVFYFAASLVLQGKGTAIYLHSPDRFLYAPGFAWFLSPLAIFSKAQALLIWNVIKMLCGIGTVWIFSNWIQKENPKITSGNAFAVALFSFIFIARPLLIDFQYGQINFIILAISAAALYFHFCKEKASLWHLLVWLTCTCFAVAKLYTLPLLAIPFLIKTKAITPQKLKAQRFGILIGVLAIFLLPLLTVGLEASWKLHQDWFDALKNKGFPIESHNQSLLAFLYRFLSGEKTHVIALGPHWKLYGWPLLSPAILKWLGFLWMTLTGGWLLCWIFFGSTQNTLRWSAITIGSLLLPAYLLWKPYFVMTLPLATACLTSQKKLPYFALGLGFLLLNFSGYDFVGYALAGKLEAASLFFFIHLGLLLSLRPCPWRLKSRQLFPIRDFGSI